MQPDTAPTLKPCPNPWCASHNKRDAEIFEAHRPLVVESGGSSELAAACPVCPMQGPWADSEAEAIAAWNTRAPQPTPCTECERLAEALEDIAEHETDCPSMTATEAMEHTISEIRDKARSALASHTVRLIDGGEHG